MKKNLGKKKTSVGKGMTFEDEKQLAYEEKLG